MFCLHDHLLSLALSLYLFIFVLIPSIIFVITIMNFIVKYLLPPYLLMGGLGCFPLLFQYTGAEKLCFPV